MTGTFQFQPGQKVRFTGEHLNVDDPPTGAVGTIVGMDSYQAYIVDYGVAEVLTYADEMEAVT